MYVLVYEIRVSIHEHTCCTSIWTSAHTFFIRSTCESVSSYMRVYMHNNAHIFTHALYIYIYMCVCVCVCIYIYTDREREIYIYARAHTHTYTRIHTYICIICESCDVFSCMQVSSQCMRTNIRTYMCVYAQKMYTQRHTRNV
jgi:hypothetical protein